MNITAFIYTEMRALFPVSCHFCTDGLVLPGNVLFSIAVLLPLNPDHGSEDADDSPHDGYDRVMGVNLRGVYQFAI
jgi:hypothetical protein